MKRTTLLVAWAMTAALSGCASNDGPRLDDVEVSTRAYDPEKSPALNLLEMTGVDKGYRDVEIEGADLAKIRKEGAEAKFEWSTGFTATSAVVNFMSGGLMGLATGALFLDWSDDYDQRTWNGAGVSFVVIPAEKSRLEDPLYQEQLRQKAITRVTEISAAAGTRVTIGDTDRHGYISLVVSSPEESRYCKSVRQIIKKSDWKCYEKARPEIVTYIDEVQSPSVSIKQSVVVAVFFSTINYPFSLAAKSRDDVITLVQAKQVTPFAIYKTEFPFMVIDGTVYPFIKPIDGKAVTVDVDSVTLYTVDTKRKDESGTSLLYTEKLQQ